MVAKNAEERRTDSGDNNDALGDDITREVTGTLEAQGRSLVESARQLSVSLHGETIARIGPSTPSAIVFVSKDRATGQPVTREFLVSTSAVSQPETAGERQLTAQRTRSERVVDAALQELDDSDIAQVADAVSSRGDGLDERFWGPAPTRTAAAASTLNDLRRQHDDRRALAAGGITRTDAAELLGISRQAVTGRLDARQLVGVKTGREWRLPTWQFEFDSTTGVLPGLDRLQRVFPGGPVALSKWVQRPSPDLDGHAPREMLAVGDDDRVCAVAEALTAAGW